MRWLVVLFVIVCASCAGREGAAWVPRLALRGSIVRHLDVPSEAAGWDWRIGGALFFAHDEPLGIEPEDERGAAVIASELACRDAALCAWERSARAEALARMEREELR